MEITFYHTSPKEYTQTAKEILQLVKKFGLDAIIFTGDIVDEKGAVILEDVESGAAGIGELFFGINSNLSADEQVAHEATHEYIRQRLPEALDYSKTVRKNIDKNSKEYKMFRAALKASKYTDAEIDKEVEAHIGG